MSSAAKFKWLFTCLFGSWIFCPAAAQGAFLGTYQLSNWSLTNINGNGSVTTLDGGLSAILSGPNNGGGLPGVTDLLITAPDAGVVAFDWSYSSLDKPGGDWAGYMIAGAFLQLSAATGLSGSSGFLISAGQQFGFVVQSADNLGEPGILTITDFTVNQAVAPEPGNIFVVLLWSTALLVRVWRPRAAGAEPDKGTPLEGLELLRVPDLSRTLQAARHSERGRQTW